MIFYNHNESDENRKPDMPKPEAKYAGKGGARFTITVPKGASAAEIANLKERAVRDYADMLLKGMLVGWGFVRFRNN